MFFMQKGTDAPHLAKGLMDTVEDEQERRDIINTMTNGLLDLYEALLAKFGLLQEEEQDMKKRQREVDEWERRQKKAISDIQKQMESLQELLKKPRFEEPPEADDSGAVAAAREQMFAEKEASIKAYMLEVRRLRALLEEWRAKVAAECDMEAMTQLREEIAEWKRKRHLWNGRTDKYDEMASEIDSRNRALEDKIRRNKELQDSLRDQLAQCGGINPDSLKMKRLQRRMAELDREAKKIKAAMAGPTNRIKAMRAQLRELYKKLGWEWDLSDSEDEGDEDKPYWQRRKLAVNGFLPFNQQEFLYVEKDFHKRRINRAQKTREIVKSREIVTQMKAKRQEFGGSSTARSLITGPEEEEAGPTIFGKDEPSTEPVDPVQRAIASYAERMSSLPGKRAELLGESSAEGRLESSCWRQARHAEEQESKQIELGRLLQLRESFEVQIQQCVECFVDLLPPSGSLGHLRSRLSSTLSKLRCLPEDPTAWQAQDLEREIQDTCETLQAMIEEAISYGDQVHPISAAMIHSVRFSDLRVLLSEVLQIERKVRETIRAPRGVRQRRDTSQYEYSPPLTPSGQPGFFPSASSSPRFRGQSAPGGSDLDGSDLGGDFSGLTLNANSRGFLSPDDLSDSLKLPPRLGGRKLRKESCKKVDFGFRPDGTGEDSVENWSLFKVSKASTATSGFGESVSTGFGLTTSSGFIGDKMRRTETKLRRHKFEADCHFHEYMSNTQQGDEASWRVGSAPVSSPVNKVKKKTCPPLPKLVHSGSASRTLIGANTMKGDVLGTWGKAPPRVSLRVSVSAPSGKFATMAASNGMLAKW
jgi:hypothetical protein